MISPAILGSLSAQSSESPPVGSAYYDQVMSMSPFLYWRLGESGPTLEDSSGNGRTGTLTGGYTRGQSSLVNDADKATLFDGSNGAGYNNGSTIAYSEYGTVIAVVKTSSLAGGYIAGFANLQSGAASAYDRFCYVDSNGKFRASTYVGGQQSMVSTSTVNDGQAHVVAFTWSPSGGLTYFDGEQEGSSSGFTGGDATGRFFRIAFLNFSTYPAYPSSYALAGTLDEIQYYDRVLTAEEILDNFMASQ